MLRPHKAIGSYWWGMVLMPLVLLITGCTQGGGNAATMPVSGEEEAVLTVAPNVPPPEPPDCR